MTRTTFCSHHHDPHMTRATMKHDVQSKRSHCCVVQFVVADLWCVQVSSLEDIPSRQSRIHFSGVRSQVWRFVCGLLAGISLPQPRYVASQKISTFFQKGVGAICWEEVGCEVIGYHLWTRKHRPVFREHDSEDDATLVSHW